MFDLRGCTLLDRKRVLHALLENVKGPIKYSEHLEANGPDVFRSACELELEGIVSKRTDGKYESGRTNVWTKTTCRHRETFVVAGVAQKQGSFDGLYLGQARARKARLCREARARLQRDGQDAAFTVLFEKLKTKRSRSRLRADFRKRSGSSRACLSTRSFEERPGRGCCGIRRSKGVRQDLME